MNNTTIKIIKIPKNKEIWKRIDKIKREGQLGNSENAYFAGADWMKKLLNQNLK